MVNTLPSNARGTGSIPAWKPRSHMPGGQKAKTGNRSNTVTNSIKTLEKWLTLRKKRKKEKPQAMRIQQTLRQRNEAVHSPGGPSPL